MNEKQNIITAALVHRFGGGLVIALAILVGILIGYLGGHWHVLQLQTQVKEQRETIDALYERAETYDYQQHIAMVELGIERAASQGLQQELQ